MPAVFSIVRRSVMKSWEAQAELEAFFENDGWKYTKRIDEEDENKGKREK